MLPSMLTVSAVVPSLLLVWYFHRRDLYPEPGKVVWTTFALGVAVIPGVLLVALPIGIVLKPIPDPTLAGFLGAFLTAAIPEEAFKLLVVRGYAARHPAFDEPMDGVVYGAIASLGFATLENVLYVASGGLGVAALRAFTAVPAHAFMGAIMGYYVGRAKFHPTERAGALFKAYFVPMVLHGLYDFPVLTLRETAERRLPTEPAVLLLPIAIAAFITLWVWAIRGLRRSRADQDRLAAAGVSPSPPVVPALTPAPAFVPALAPAAAPAPHVPASVQPRRDATWIGGTVLLVLGIGSATVGGFVVLGVLLALATRGVPAGQEAPAIVGMAVAGVLPLLVGFLLFGFGLRSLNRGSMPVRAG